MQIEETELPRRARQKGEELRDTLPNSRKCMLKEQVLDFL